MGDEQETTPVVPEQADTATPEVPTDVTTGETPGSSVTTDEINPLAS